MTFLTDARVVLSTRDIVRIPRYAALIEPHRATAVMIQLEPCPGAMKLRRWYICKP